MRRSICTASGLAMLLVGASGASAAGLADLARGAAPDHGRPALVHKVHSLYEAKQTLYGLGYYDVRLERASLPYSFNACKRGVRYHIHVNYYGDLEQVDPVGDCREYDDDYDDYGYRNRRYPYRSYDY